ncbi:MAG: uracil-DNA glycosylase family protein [Smithella sp.]
MNPFKDGKILSISSSFYKKYYNDNKPRHLILGINPGRFGAGVTGVPFTDTKRLRDKCGLNYSGQETHEPSSVFVYEVIDAYGGVEKFYNAFYINAVCPLGFTISDARGREKNYNYYDSKELTDAVYGFIIDSIKAQIRFGIETDICYCFGTGKNENFLRRINDENAFFKKIIALEHPRYVMQYKAKVKNEYIKKYIEAFDQAKPETEH